MSATQELVVVTEEELEDPASLGPSLRASQLEIDVRPMATERLQVVFRTPPAPAWAPARRAPRNWLAMAVVVLGIAAVFALFT